MMSTPSADSPAVSFDVVRRGYDPDQVTNQLEKLHYDLRIATADQELTAARVSQLMEQLAAEQAETERLRIQLDQLAAAPLAAANLPEAMQLVVEKARREAANIRAAADVDAMEQRQRAAASANAELTAARNEAAKISAAATHQSETLDEQRAAFHEEQEQLRTQLAAEISEKLAAATATADATIAEASREAAENIADARREASELLAAAARKRAEESEDFELVISARRAEAYEAISAQQQQAASDAANRLAQAADQSADIIAETTRYAHSVIASANATALERVTDADAAVQALNDVRATIIEQLAALGQQLTALLDTVHSAPDILTPPAAEADRPRPADFSDPRSWEPPPMPQRLHDALHAEPGQPPTDTPLSGDGHENAEQNPGDNGARQ